jgi:acyl-CoA hydrolase/GNAT superfamily N-acetyltransferase
MKHKRKDIAMSKFVSAGEAISHVQSGSRVFVGSGGAEPQTLVRELARQAGRLRGVEVTSLLTLGSAEYADPALSASFRHNAYFIGSNVRRAVREGRADYTPVFLSEIPHLIDSGQHRVDVALLKLSPPDAQEMCSMGISVDIQRAALESARLVIAEIDPSMPRTCGQAALPLSRVHYLVKSEDPLLEAVFAPDSEDVASRIGLHVASLIDDGSCLQLGIGAIPDAVARNLAGKRHLGVHTEMLSEGLYQLMEAGAIDNSRKQFFPGVAVTSFAMGSRSLYDWLDGNSDVEFHPSNIVNDPRLISRNDKVIAVNSALQVDLTGQVCSDSLGYDFYSGIGGQVDFTRGAAMSKGGRPIIALPSTAKKGAVSRIVAHLDEGAGVVTSRGDVHYIVTEHGVAYLHGKTVRERAMALVGVAQPAYREELLHFVRGRHYVHLPKKVWEDALNPYPNEWRSIQRFGTVDLHVRPVKPTDARHLQEFFYSHTPETVYHRYFAIKKEMTEEEAAHLCTLDYRERMAFGVFDQAGGDEKFVAIGRYDLDPKTHLAETALVVAEPWRRRGIGHYLLHVLTEYAKSQGFSGITSHILAGNEGALRLHRALGHKLRLDRDTHIYRIEQRFPRRPSQTVASEDKSASAEPSEEPEPAGLGEGSERNKIPWFG